MAIDVKIEELNPSTVAEVEAELVTMLSDRYPTLDLVRGRVLRDIVLRLAAVVAAVNLENIDRLRKSSSLLEIQSDPAAADDEVVDAILSNYRITRQAASATTGSITIVLDALIGVTVFANTRFTAADGSVFLTTASYNAVTTEALVVSPNDRLLRARSDGRYTFTIPVVAQTAGATVIRQDVRFTMDPEVNGLFDVYAEDDFTTGLAEDDNTTLVARLQEGITAQTMAGRAHIEALLRANFLSLIDLSIIGLGDAELTRAQDNVLGISTPGKTDIYVRTASIPMNVALELTGVLDEAENYSWRLVIPKHLAPGYYRIESVLPTDRVGTSFGSLEVLSETRALNLVPDADEFVPYISGLAGIYTSYQTSTIRVKDPAYPVVGLVENQSQRSFTVVVSAAPDLAAIQQFVLDRSRRNPGTDYLVRAAIPCYVNVELIIERPYATVAIDTLAIQHAVASVVNAITFAEGRLPVSRIADAVQSLLPARAALKLPIHVMGRIYMPDATILVNTSTSMLEAPNRPDLGVTSRTTAFYLDAMSVSVTVNTVSVKEV